MKTDTKLPVVKDSLTPNSDTPTQIIYRRVEKDIDSNKWWWATCYSVKEAENLVNLLNGYEKKLAASQAEVERLNQWKDNLISNLMALEIYEHKHYDDPFIALAAYGQWNWNAGEWASKSDATMLRSQLNRAVEIAEDLSSGDAWKFTGADEKLAALKGEIK
jgi:hypothetical protein